MAPDLIASAALCGALVIAVWVAARGFRREPPAPRLLTTRERRYFGRRDWSAFDEPTHRRWPNWAPRQRVSMLLRRQAD